ncbi:MAG: RidA family protein [Pseudomonadota bacterium]
MVQRFDIGPRLSDMVIHNHTIYLAGQVADDPKQGIEEQTRQVLAHVDRLLAQAGSDKTNILSATIYLASMGDYAAMNRVWDTWVPQGHTPARATVEARLAHPDYRVEVQIIAAQP